MSAAETLERALLESERLKELRPRLSAVGVGGSLGRGKADAYSDIDLFLFFDDGDVFRHAHWLMSNLNHVSEPISTGTPDYFSGFGIRVGYVLPDLGKLEYFLNTPASWTADPMRANTRVIWDISGLFTGLIEASATLDLGVVRQARVSELLHVLLLNAMDVKKHAERKDFLGLEYRLAIVRRTMSALVLTEWVGDDPVVHDALARVGGLPAEMRHSATVGLEPNCRAPFREVLNELSDLASSVASVEDADPRWTTVAQHLAAAARGTAA